MRKRALLLILCLAAPAWGGPKLPVAWQVDPPKPCRPGARLTLTLRGQIDPGWHLYSLEQAEGGPIATTIALAEGDPAELGEAREAKPTVASDPAFDVPTRFFAGTAVFRLQTTVNRGAAPGSQALHVLVRYQSCNGQLCLPPHTDTVPVPLTIQP